MESLMMLMQIHPPEQVRHSFHAAGFALFGFGLATAAIVLLLGILFLTLAVTPNLTQRGSNVLRGRSLLSFLAGLPIVAAFLILEKIAAKAPVLQGIIATLFGVVLILAYAATAEDIGRRVFWACGKDASRATHLAAGWLVFAFGSLFPVIGWFLVFPYGTLSGLGSVVVGAFSSAKSTTTSES